MRFQLRKAILTALMVAVFLSGISGCEDCDREYQACISELNGSVGQFTFEETCRYPSMNRGDAKLFCDCEDQRAECRK